MQQKKAGLRGDGQTDLISDFDAIATFETLLSNEDLNVTEQLSPVSRREPGEKSDVAPDYFQPLLWKRSRLQMPSPALLQQRKDHRVI